MNRGSFTLRKRHALAAWVGVCALCAGARAGHADLLVLRDGRVVEGVAALEGDTWRVAGVQGVAEFPRADVERHVPGPSIDQQVSRALGELRADDHAGRLRVAAFLVEWGRVDEGHALAQAVLARDPEHGPAHTLLGHVRHGGRWMTPDEAKRASGLEQHGGQWFTPDEWRNLPPDKRLAVLGEETVLVQREAIAAIRRDVALLIGPNPEARREARERLTRRARDAGVPEGGLAEALAAADALVQRAQEVETAHAGALAAGAAGATGAPGRGRQRNWVLAEIRDDFARLKRPIDLFSTTLASTAAPVTIMLPEVRLVQIRTTTAIPVAPGLGL